MIRQTISSLRTLSFLLSWLVKVEGKKNAAKRQTREAGMFHGKMLTWQSFVCCLLLLADRSISRNNGVWSSVTKAKSQFVGLSWLENPPERVKWSTGNEAPAACLATGCLYSLDSGNVMTSAWIITWRARNRSRTLPLFEASLKEKWSSHWS